MKDWRDKRMIDYLEGFNAELPQSDWDDFLSRKAAHDVAAKRRHGFLIAAISIPAAAAVLLLLFLLPIKRTPAGQTAQNNPEPPQEELQATTDSISNPVDSVIDIIAEPVPVKNKVAMTSVATPVRMSNDSVSFNLDTYRQQLDSMLVRNNKTKEELDSITADMMERVTAYEQKTEPAKPNMTYGSLEKQRVGATGEKPLSESHLSFGGSGSFGGFGGFGGSGGFGGVLSESPLKLSIPAEHEYDGITYCERVGTKVTDYEIARVIARAHRPDVDKDNLENNRVYRVKNYPDLDNVWDVFQVDIDKKDTILKSIQMALFIPHNFDFVPSKEDSINIVMANLNKVLVKNYGESIGGSVWRTATGVDIILSAGAVNINTRDRYPDYLLEGHGSSDGYIITIQCIKADCNGIATPDT